MTYDTPVFSPESSPIMGGDCTHRGSLKWRAKLLSRGLSLFQIIPPLDPTSKRRGPDVQVWDLCYGSFLLALEGIWAME